MNNIIILNECIKEFKEENELELNDSEIYEIFSMLQITKDSDTSYEEITDSIVDGSNDGGIDSFMILINDKCIIGQDIENFKITEKANIKVIIGQVKTENSFKEKLLNDFAITLPLIFDLSKEENDLLIRLNPQVVEKIMTFREIWKLSIRKKANMSIEFAYITKSDNILINEAFESKMNQILELCRSFLPLAISNFNLYSSKEILEIYQKKIPDVFELKFIKDPMPYAYTEDEYGYVGLVNLYDYFDFLVDQEKNIREDIFEENIRHFQGEVDVNKSIKNTLSDDFKNDFWWLNNGVTILVSECGPRIQTLFLENVKIVNGLQTSYSIYRYVKNLEQRNKEARSVLVKIIKSKEKSTIDKIIKASNSQNPVPPTLLRATDEIQRKIEEKFLENGFYYDRRKGYYKNQNKPSNKIFSIQYVAQSIEAILNFNPSSARSKPTTLIKTDKSYNNIFNSKRDFISYLNCCLVHKETENFIRTVEQEKKGLAKNFAFHISRITMSLYFNDFKYSFLEMSNMDINKMNKKYFQNAYNELMKILDEYIVKNPNNNVINISKSVKFDDEITRYLEEKLG